VDDHRLIREGLLALLRESSLVVPFEAASGREAVRIAQETKPQVILMDIMMPEMDGIEACRQIKAKLPSTAVLMLTTYEDTALLKRALEAGASGYLLKGSSRAALVNAIRTVVSGNSVIDSSLLARVSREIAASGLDDDERRRLASLSPRETAILQSIAAGRTNEEIALAVNYSVGTVKNAVQAIIVKLGVSDRVQAAVLAARAGLLSRDQK
jgi:DNA-binding NarL/FixJ family response regulator